MSEFEQVDGPIVGYRTWGIHWLSDIGETTIPWRLEAIFTRITWEPGVNTAICNVGWDVISRTYNSNHPDARSPAFNCRCGIYMLRDLLPAERMSGLVVGAIQGWGKIVEHDDGWRCEKAQIVALQRFITSDKPPEVPKDDQTKKFISVMQSFGASGVVPPELRGSRAYIPHRAHRTVIDRLAMAYDVRVCNYDYELVHLVERMRKGKA